MYKFTSLVRARDQFPTVTAPNEGLSFWRSDSDSNCCKMTIFAVLCCLLSYFCSKRLWTLGGTAFHVLSDNKMIRNILHTTVKVKARLKGILIRLLF